MPAHMVSHDKSRESQHPSACSLHLPASVLESGRGLGASWAQLKGPDSNSGKTEQPAVSQAQGGGALVTIHWCHITCVGGCVGDRVGRAVGTTVGSWEEDGCVSRAQVSSRLARASPCPTRTILQGQGSSYRGWAGGGGLQVRGGSSRSQGGGSQAWLSCSWYVYHCRLRRTAWRPFRRWPALFHHLRANVRVEGA